MVRSLVAKLCFFHMITGVYIFRDTDRKYSYLWSPCPPSLLSIHPVHEVPEVQEDLMHKIIQKKQNVIALMVRLNLSGQYNNDKHKTTIDNSKNKSTSQFNCI